jgi:hypothetical protein
MSFCKDDTTGAEQRCTLSNVECSLFSAFSAEKDLSGKTFRHPPVSHKAAIAL